MGQDFWAKSGSRLCCDRHYKNTEKDLLYEQLLSGLDQMLPRIPCPENDADVLNDVLHRILLDHPALCHFEGQWRFGGGLLPVYTLTPQQRAAMEQETERVASHLSSAASDDAQRVRAAYLWLAQNVRYDLTSPHSQSAYGALVERRAVCKGIAKAYQLLLRKMGIPCILVEGSLDGDAKHVWNLYYFQGQWRHSDVTMYYPEFAARRKTGDPMEFFSMPTDSILLTHSIYQPDLLPTSREHFFQTLRKSAPRPGRPADLLPPRLRSRCSGQLRHVDSGSVSDVYATTFRGAPAVIKQIRCGLDMNRMYHAMREVSMMQLAQSCPGTVRLLESDISRTPDGFTVFLVQEQLTSLDEFCLRPGVTVRSALRITLDLCKALEQCWDAGVAHLDIQPGNLFVDAAGRAKLGDFSSALSVEELATVRDLRGTPAYMAPEVHRDCRYSQASEVCSLGIVLYSLLCGGVVPFADGYALREAAQRRFAGEPVRLPETFSAELRTLVEKACAHDPRLRYATLRQMRQALELLLSSCGDEPIRAAEAVSSTGPDTAATHSVLCASHTDYSLWENEYGVSRRRPETSCKAPGLIDPEVNWDGDTIDPFATIDHTVFPDASMQADSFASSVAIQADRIATSVRPIRPEISTFPSLWEADSFGSTTALSAPTPAGTPEPAPVRVDQVQFSAVSPQTATKGEYTIVQLFMYEQAFRSAVDEALQMGDGPMQEKKTGFYQVAQNTRVKVVLSSADVEIPDDTLEQIWTGGYLSFDFALEIPFTFLKRQILLKAAVYFNDIPATRLLLTMKTRSLREQKLELTRTDVLTAFVSYASQDRTRVGTLVQGMRKARPDMDIFFDVNSLRSGEDWEAALHAEIEKRDTLFLCWSNHARQSPWVDREWRYALAQKGPDAIEPIPIDPPDICPPPEELKNKHFNDNMLYIINR